MSNPFIPINSVNISSQGVVKSDIEMFLDHVLAGSQIAQRGQEIALQKEALKQHQQQLKDAEAQHQAEILQTLKVGEAARQLYLSGEQTQLPAGSIPFGAASQAPMTVTSPFGQQLQGLPPEAVLPFLQATEGIRASRADQANQAAADRIVGDWMQGGAKIEDLGKVLAPSINPKVMTLVLGRLGSLVGLQQAGANLTGKILENRGQGIQNVTAEQTLATQAATRRVLARRLQSGAWTPDTVAETIAEVTAIDPAQGKVVGDALSGFIPPKATPATEAERAAGGFAGRLLEANTTMTAFERRHPEIAAQLDAKLRLARAAGSLPWGIGKGVESVVTPALLRNWGGKATVHIPGLGDLPIFPSKVAKQEIADYINARYAFGNAVLRDVSGAQINAEELDREIIPFVLMEGQPLEALPEIQQRRLQRALQAVHKAGPGFNVGSLSPHARRAVLDAIAAGQIQPPTPPQAPLQLPGSTPGTTVVPR